MMISRISALSLKRPLVTLFAGWIVLLALAVILERFADEHSLPWFFYRHSLMLGFIIASHLGVLLRRNAGTVLNAENLTG